MNRDAKLRRCLKCLRDFKSRDNANRVCSTCKRDTAMAARCAPASFIPPRTMTRTRPGIV
jgi:hypothetical protein